MNALEKLVNRKNNGKIAAEIALSNIKDIISDLDGAKSANMGKQKFRKYEKILNIIIENKNNKNLTYGYIARKIRWKKKLIVDSIHTIYLYSKSEEEMEKRGGKGRHGKGIKTRFKYLMTICKINYPKRR